MHEIEEQPNQDSVAMADYMALAEKYASLKAQREWVGLTDEEREFLLHQALRFYDTNAQLLSFIKTVEAKLIAEVAMLTEVVKVLSERISKLENK